MHGTADSAVHHENSVELVEKVRLHGGQAEIVLYPGQRHGFFSPGDTAVRRPDYGNGAYFDRTTQEMTRFIDLTVMERS